MKPDLSLIIVTYNSAAHIARLLTSIKKQSAGLTVETIVVDNASADRTVDQVLAHPQKPKLIQTRANLGFSKAVNQGIKASTADYIMLLNPDTVLVGKALKILLDYAQTHPGIGAVAPRLLDPAGKPQASAFRFPTVFNAIKTYFFGRKNAFGKYLPPNRTGRIDVAVMAALLIPKAVIDRIGGLDERFFLYYEDIEFCRRLKKHRLPLIYLPLAKVKHVHGASGNFKEHLQSPLAKSARLYHGPLTSFLLNTVLFFGQKYRKVINLVRFR